MQWLAPQYHDLLKRIQQNGIKGLDTSLVNELTVIEKLQKDIGEIHVWPFDEGVIARLAAIIISISTVLFSSYIQSALHI